MKIVRIFVGTFAVVEEEGGKDALRDTFDTWQDVEALEAFFEENKADLQGGFFGRMSVEDAVLRTIKEARQLEGVFVRIARARQEEAGKAMDAMFRPLDDLEHRQRAMSLRKAKSKEGKGWLRLYAVKVDQGTFVISGGCIKLTHKLNERQHTRQALAKVQRLAAFLRSQGVTDEDSLREVVLEG